MAYAIALVGGIGGTLTRWWQTYLSAVEPSPATDASELEW